MKVREDVRILIAATLNRLPFVCWDRYVADEDGLYVYGWIARGDGRSDFVLLEFDHHDGSLFTFTTSSSARSREIDRLLRGTDEGHIDCLRVDEDFGDVVTSHTKAAA